MKKLALNLLLLVSLATWITSCGESDGKKLRVATAASAQFVLKEIGEQFGKEHDVEVEVISGSSGKLTTQILNSAPFDLFFAANMMYPTEVQKAGKANGDPVIYGYGIPVFWTMYDDIKLTADGQFLLDSRIEKIAIADPKNAPYGEMAIQYLKDNKIYDKVEHKLVYGESISQVNEYITHKTVEVGIGAKSVVLSPDVEEKGQYLDLGEQYKIEQGAVILTNTADNELKQQFMDF
ncbi:MAG: molybdate ABC transporter substrate-binding protein, partial [Flavobacteriales bacterium]|nr:molybdate ABC transporter substrate-binding protein [Flavobacteriales bacterium]